MKNISPLLYGIFVLFLIVTEPAHAYIDPAIANVVIQAILAGLIVCGVWWRKIRMMISGCFGNLSRSRRDRENENHSSDLQIDPSKINVVKDGERDCSYNVRSSRQAKSK